MTILIKDMEMPSECHGCRWFYFQGTSCTKPRYYLDARCELVESGQDWWGKDSRGGWIGESIEHIPGWAGYYSHKHCVEEGTRASQCPLCELPSARPEKSTEKRTETHACDLISRQAAIDAVNRAVTQEVASWSLQELPSAQPEQNLDEWCADCREYDKEKHCCPRFNRVIRTAMADASRWISCDEQLPETDEMMLVTAQPKKGAPNVNRAYYMDGAWHGSGSMSNVIAWMPLPDPYEPEG